LIGTMPRPRPPHLHSERTRHGRQVWYVRVGRGPRIRLRADFGTDNFRLEYEAAIRGERPSITGPKTGSLEWLIARYRETGAWRSLSTATRRQRENIFRQIVKSGAATQPYTAITAQGLSAARDKRADTPAQARHLIDTMRGLFKWAKGAGFVKINPAADVEYPTQRKTQGFPVWTEDDLARYEARWQLGTKERVWLAVLLYTGLRRGDAVKIGKQHVRNGVMMIRTEKSQGQIDVTIPVLPELEEALRTGPVGELAFICGDRGGPLTKESFGNMFSEACRAAGIRKSAHGVRKAGATRAANNGATVAQLEAIFGWVGGRMASHYTRSADRARLAREAIGKLGNDGGTSIPAPGEMVRAAAAKD
jgi:integrase